MTPSPDGGSAPGSGAGADVAADSFSVSHILLATDGSPGAEAAAAHAVALAARTDATLHVLAVVDDRHADSFSTEQMRRRERTRAAMEGEEATATAARRATAAGVHALTAVEEGRPASVIADYAAEVGVDVVVVGTHGRTGLDRFLLGSVAEAVVDAVDAAVLAVPTVEGPDPTPDYRRHLLAVGSDGSADRAADAAVSLAAAYDAEVTALSVVDERFARPSALRTSLESAARESVRAVAVDAAERGVSVDTVVETGVPATRVLDAAEDGVDLVVVGGRGRRGLDAVPLGSVARRVVRRSRVPVLVVRGENRRKS
ncbi:universal stress protein [Halogeometricum pallidum JCM 14848]|uniref:Universal stress protein n=1 Tax=Halogeometricum pallidum JCM 14848 TaxID=1227487 RepID=M0DHE3_HALPD|nr:universal stress protein [Halogeometricum pallidum]ELZ34921.1 universal stress protein [Halogeometricum pallidum JCM 14848]